MLTFTQPGAPPPARDFDLGEGFYSLEYSQKVSKLPYEHVSERLPRGAVRSATLDADTPFLYHVCAGNPSEVIRCENALNYNFLK